MRSRLGFVISNPGSHVSKKVVWASKKNVAHAQVSNFESSASINAKSGLGFEVLQKCGWASRTWQSGLGFDVLVHRVSAPLKRKQVSKIKMNCLGFCFSELGFDKCILNIWNSFLHVQASIFLNSVSAFQNSASTFCIYVFNILKMWLGFDVFCQRCSDGILAFCYTN